MNRKCPDRDATAQLSTPYTDLSATICTEMVQAEQWWRFLCHSYHMLWWINAIRPSK